VRFEYVRVFSSCRTRRAARYAARTHDNDHVDGSAIYHCAVDHVATNDIHNGDRAAEFVHVDEQCHAATHDDHYSGRYDDIGLSIDLG
jgi:hypothetical protein